MDVFSSLDKEIEELEEILDNFSEEYDVMLKCISLLVAITATGDTKLIYKYSNRFLEVSTKIKNKSIEANALGHMSQAFFYYFTSKFEDALKHSDLALEILKSTNRKEMIGCANFFKGAAGRSLGEIDLAVKHLILATEQISTQSYLVMYNSFSHYHLGEIYLFIKDYTSSEKHYLLAGEISQKLKNSAGIFRSKNGLANLYLQRKEYEKAEKLLLESLEIENITYTQISRSLCDLGILYHLNLNYLKSKEYLNKSIKIRREHMLFDPLSTSLIALAELELDFNHINDAKPLVVEALELTTKNQSKSKQIKCYKLLSRIKENNGEYKEALEAFKTFEKMQSEQYTIQNNNIYQINKKKIEDQKNIIESYLQEIKDSISYAKRIQQSILPSIELTNKLLKEYFIIYLPKDVVAGDFYWVEKHDNYIYIAVADCTGHGVPGAMVSVVCNYALNRCLFDYQITETNEILNKTRELVIEQFSKSGEDVKDGMDISLCRIDYKNNMLQWSGANNPLWLIRNNLLQEYKPDKMPIGKYLKNENFNKHELNILKGDNFYLFTDGIADQFGGPSNKKLLYKRLKEFLTEINSESIDKRKELITKTFENWKGDNQQIDDVCVVGFSF